MRHGWVVIVAIALLSVGCVKHERFWHGQYQVEVTDRISMFGSTVTATSTCQKADVLANGDCDPVKSIGPALSQSSGVGLPIISTLTGAGAMVGSAALIRDGLKKIPPSNTSLAPSQSQSNVNAQTANSSGNTTSVTPARAHYGH